VHAADVALALRVLVENAPMAGEAYNVASGIETPISRLAATLAEAVASGSRVEFTGEARPGDPLRWLADISRIRSLGYEPRIGLDAGLAEYASWYLREGPSA
jgi:nucleoside-diphosphate-sugar epimerase